MLAVCFAVIAVWEWMQIKNKSTINKKVFWWCFSIILIWNLAANFIPWWPNPNNIILSVFKWV